MHIYCLTYYIWTAHDTVMCYTVCRCIIYILGARYSLVVRAAPHGVIGSIPHSEPIELLLVPASAPQPV